MRTQLSTLGLVTALVLSLASTATQAQEPDLSGTWSLTMLDKSATGARDGELQFAQDGFNLEVTMSTEKGSVSSVGYIDGPEIRFYYVRPSKKGDIVAKFTGHVRGDLMGGEVDMGKAGTTTWTATRGPAETASLTGTWTLQMKGESPSGLNLVKMSFSQDGANVVVTLQSDAGDVECEGTIDQGILTFFYVRPTGDKTFVAKFSGEIAGAYIGGEVDMGDLGKTTWRATQDI